MSSSRITIEHVTSIHQRRSRRRHLVTHTQYQPLLTETPPTRLMVNHNRRSHLLVNPNSVRHFDIACLESLHDRLVVVMALQTAQPNQWHHPGYPSASGTHDPLRFAAAVLET